MTINGKIHCLFEQSGTFKDEFIKLGYTAYDYDIQNNFGKTDFVIDLFAEIERGYEGKPSVFDTITPDDLIMAFFPCIYFCEINQRFFSGDSKTYRAMNQMEKIAAIIEREKKREKFYVLLLKLFGIAEQRGLRLIVENPYSVNHYLHENFPYRPAVIDTDRTRRGDCFKKPTQYFFCNCEPTHGQTFTGTKVRKTLAHAKASKIPGICSEERSMISPEYAHNFICDFILGKTTANTQLDLFS